SFEAFPNRAVNLRHAAQAVGVLYAFASEMRLANFAVLQKSGEPLRNLALTLMRAGLMDPRIECNGRALESFKGHGSSQVRKVYQLLRARPTDDSACKRGLSSVEQGETFLRLEVKRGDADSFECLASGYPRGGTEDLAFTDQDECKMGQRC